MATLTCPSCGFDSPANFRFCGQCGAQLISETNPRAHKSADSNFPRVDRRQLTVLFCDLIGSTQLSQQLDIEDLRDVIRKYQTTCAPVIERLGGYVSRYMGDGILAFFGYPRASEDDAIQAVQAGIDIIDTLKTVDWISRFGTSSNIAVRVGISTGVVVAGDLIGKGAAEQEAVVGETPNLAARLQSLAEPNTVLISSRTHRIVRDQFTLTSVGKHTLKGFADPVEVWRANSRKRHTSRFEAKRASGITPLINRYDEMKRLKDHWEKAKLGTSQLFVISGEPGIGKSRITEALRLHIADEPHYYLRYQCSAYHSNTALYPIATHIERAAGIARGDSNVVKRDKLNEFTYASGLSKDYVLSAFAALLSIPNAPDDEFEQLSARDKKVATLNALNAHIMALSRIRPILAVVEDVHWSDPTSLELLSQFNQNSGSAKILILLTCRDSEFRLEEEPSNTKHINLSRLTLKYSSELVKTVVGDSTLPPYIIDRIISKTDGVPLFAEELTKTLLEKAKLSSTSGIESAEIDDSEIPDTLQDLLMARLDSLGAGKRVAQIAAIIGRQFKFELIESIADVGQRELQNGFSRLIQSELIVASGSDHGIFYNFKHALIRDTAYGSLLREERREFHKRIAVVLESDTSDVSAELLARHYTEAGLSRQATDCWLLAGKEASQRSSYHEAVEQFQSGLRLLRQQAPSEKRDRKLLEYLANLGPAHIATSGSGTTETEAVYREAVALIDSLPESEDHFTALWGWWRISNNFETDAERADRLQELADRLGDDGLKLQAHHCQWATRFHLGDHQGCLHHIYSGLALYADRDYRSHAARFGGHDPRVCALGEMAQSLWLTGHPDQANAHIRRARLWAEELKQSGSLVHVMDMNLLLLRYQGKPQLAAEQAEELIEFAKEHQFPEYIAKAEVFKGWALAKRGMTEKGINIMLDYISLYDTIGTDEDPPVWLEMLADIYVDTGEYEAGLDAINQAFRHTEQSGLRFWDAELHRRRGELLWHTGAENLTDAHACFEQAIQISESQGARMLQLRAMVSLLLSTKIPDEKSVTLSRLTKAMNQIDEGLDTPEILHILKLIEAPVET